MEEEGWGELTGNGVKGDWSALRQENKDDESNEDTGDKMMMIKEEREVMIIIGKQWMKVVTEGGKSVMEGEEYIPSLHCSPCQQQQPHHSTRLQQDTPVS